MSFWGKLIGLAICLTVLGSTPGRSRGDLLEYVRKPEPGYRWKLQGTVEHPDGKIHDLRLTSQVWQGIPWEHQLHVYEPRQGQPRQLMLLWNTGGSPSLGNMAFGMELAKRMGAPCAFLYHVPNQPLLDGKREDALIAETFVRYLKTGDESWPLLFPMVKSVVKAMDALEGFSKEQWERPVKGFLISGASKRGWTTWLTGAADSRVKAIAPVVIDTLNMGPQLEHQKRSFGRYSEMIHDYTERGLVPVPDTPEGRKLWRMVDPYFYRDRLTMPKLIVNGTNDRYWTVDALNLYWDDLKGKKYVVYIPNAGHDLRRKDQPADRQRATAVEALVGFYKHQAKENPMPELAWEHGDAGGKARLTITSTEPPREAKVWVADAPSRDFRQSRWEARPARIEEGRVVAEVERPASGYRAFFAEMGYEIDGTKHPLSTQIRVLEPAGE